MKKVLFFILCLLSFWACQTEAPSREIVFEPEVFDAEDLLKDVGKLKLSEYGFFKGKLADLSPIENVFPYELNTPLFTDYALKKRFIYLPENTKVGYNPDEVLDFPIGTVIIKNFYYEDEQMAQGQGRILETRLLIREESEWKALPYIWNEEQTDAILDITGDRAEIALVGKETVNYQIPNMAQCKSCHERDGKIEPIGPNARQLNRMNIYEGQSMNQLEKLSQMGFLDIPEHQTIPQLPVWDDPETGDLNQRARAYLEMNCAHCHRKEGPAKNSGLYLLAANTIEREVGIMKAPVAAGSGSGGLKYDIVPGKPDKSIIIHRMNSTKASVMMPEVGRSVIHKEGVALIKDWISSMEESN